VIGEVVNVAAEIAELVREMPPGAPGQPGLPGRAPAHRAGAAAQATAPETEQA